MQLPACALRESLERTVKPNAAWFVPAARLAHTLLGDSIATNFVLLGYAWQKGAVPIGERAILDAIELNGVAVEQNRAAFVWGRRAAHDLAEVEKAAGLAAAPLGIEQHSETTAVGNLRGAAPTLQAIVARRSEFLRAYQNENYARRYESLVRRVEDAERGRVPRDGLPLAEAVARNYFKLLAYKDEYEVARLYTDTGFLDRLRQEMDGEVRLRFHLAPPLLSRPDPVSGRPRKIEFGGWMLPVFHVLKRLRFLRGTPFDPFSYGAERKAERQLIAEYETLIGEIVPALKPDNHAVAVGLAAVPDQIRGFGPVKAAAIEKARVRREELLQKFRVPA